jgi:hypothetical protein
MASATSFYGFGVSGALSAILMGASALIMLRTGVFWSWLGWLGGLMAMVVITGSAAIVERDPEGVFSVIGPIGWLGLFVWILGVSTALVRADNP